MTTAAHYQCPLCDRKVERDLIVFLDHSQTHIVDEIKKTHPEWVAEDGTCKPCAEYYEKQLAGQSPVSNLGPSETKKRFILGIIMSVFSLVFTFSILSSGAPKMMRATLFIPFFGAVFCFLQAQKRTCAILAERGTQNLDHGDETVCDLKIAQKIRRQGRDILLKAALIALTFTALLFLL